MASSNFKEKILDVPSGLLNEVDMRVQESIHGHRFIQEQEPFMIVLETLAVCASKPLGSVLPNGDTHENFSYELPHREKMRFLLFQDNTLEQVIKDSTISDSNMWDKWKERVNQQYRPDSLGFDEFAYLDNRFSSDIHSLSQAVRLLQSLELDVINNRRWTSRFLAVTGPHMICTDMRKDARGNWSTDRRFFGRGGELVYLMLNRSSLVDEVGKLVQDRLLNPENSMNQIARALDDQNSGGSSKTQIGYLPYFKLESYDRLAKDWCTLLSCNSLPDSHLFEPLFRITALNLFVYLAERAQHELRKDDPLPIVADLMDGGHRQHRDFSKSYLNMHRDEVNRAVRAFVEYTLDTDDDWLIALERSNRSLAKERIKKLFHFEEDQVQEPKDQAESFIQRAIDRDKNNAHKYLLPLAKNSGLGTTRQGIGTWFALDDSMLIALVLSNVDEPIELRDFVATLYKRYRLVIGAKEARSEFKSIHVEHYEANLSELEARMSRLALAERLSDDCAFVTNPFK